MKIGITYDLKQEYLTQGFSEEEVAEFDDLETIEAIEVSLQSLGYQTDRIGNIRDLVKRLANGDRWDMVFNIAEGVHGLNREAQVPMLLDAYGIPYTFSNPEILFYTQNKIRAKTVAIFKDIPSPYYKEVTECHSNVDLKYLKYPLFVKPVAEGSSKGINNFSKVNNFKELNKGILDILRIFQQPVLVEEYLPGREFTVGIIGAGDNAKIIGTMEINYDADSYSYEVKQNFRNRVKYNLVDDADSSRAAVMALSVWNYLGCRDAGRIDMRMDNENVPNFLEVNALPGLNPESSDLPMLCRKAGISYVELIEMIMESAKERL